MRNARGARGIWPGSSLVDVDAQGSCVAGPKFGQPEFRAGTWPLLARLLAILRFFSSGFREDMGVPTRSNLCGSSRSSEIRSLRPILLMGLEVSRFSGLQCGHGHSSGTIQSTHSALSTLSAISGMAAARMRRSPLHPPSLVVRFLFALRHHVGPPLKKALCGLRGATWSLFRSRLPLALTCRVALAKHFFTNWPPHGKLEAEQRDVFQIRARRAQFRANFWFVDMRAGLGQPPQVDLI